MLTKTCPECGNEFGPGKWVTNFKTAKYCSNTCYQASKKFSPPKANKFFWPKVARAGSDDCWLYYRTDKAGYGRFLKVGPYVYAHRVAWIVTFGEIPEGMEVAHTCDVRACCNPAHLFLATHQENMDDCHAKDRQYSKLKAPQVREIIASDLSTRELADLYDVQPITIWAIKTKRKWKHLHTGDVEKP